MRYAVGFIIALLALVIYSFIMPEEDTLGYKITTQIEKQIEKREALLRELESR